jgi:aerobic-type carbon monoxide dehydrogenase small subunit (CoxS/CutS family)
MNEDRQDRPGKVAPRDVERPYDVSRRSFIQTLGASAAAGAVARTVDARAKPQTRGAANFVGPDPFDLTLRINGEAKRATIDPATTLLDALRMTFDLTGSKEICDRGACGGCSVLVDGKLTASCMMLAIDAEGSEITTVEGLANGETLHPIQEAFIRHDALQCGYCTPGLIMASKALLDENPTPTMDEIKRGLSGNLCRCGTYTNIFNAVLDASGQTPISDPEAGR